MAKQKRCTVKDKKGELTIETVDRTHASFKDFTPLAGEETEDADGGADGGGGAGSRLQRAGPIIKELWKPDSSLLPIFNAVHGELDKAKLFSVTECLKTLSDYVESNGLAADGDTVKLDETLTNSLYKGFGRKKGASDDDLPTTGERADMEKRLQKRLLEYHEITREGADPIRKKGHVPDVRLEENRAHGHNVTMISGLETFGWDMDDLAQHFKKRLMCTTSTAFMPGKHNKNKEVVIQGHHADPVKADLIEKYGIPQSVIKLARKG